MLKRSQKAFPVDLQLALGHEGKKVKERTALMRKQDRQLRRMLPRGNAWDMLAKDLYERPVNVIIEQSVRAREREKEQEQGKEEREETRKRASRRRK